MVWFACNCASTIIIYFVIPETKGLSLEEIGALFVDKVALNRTEDGQDIVEDVKDDGVVLAVLTKNDG